MYFQPPRSLGTLIGAVLALWATAAAIVLLNYGITSGVNVGTLLVYVIAIAMAGITVLFAYWTYSLATLAYMVDRNGLVISWGASRQVIPLGAIERLVPGTSVEGEPQVRGLSWWGYHIGGAQVGRIGRVLFYSTHQSPEQVLYVMTSERNYALSVPDPVAFAREIQTRQDLGPTAMVSHHVERSGLMLGSLFADRLALALVVAAGLACLAVWLQVVIRYPDLPATLTLRFPPGSGGVIESVVDRSAILEIPQVGTGLLAANLVLGTLAHAWERFAGYVLYGAAGALQVALFIAVLSALG